MARPKGAKDEKPWTAALRLALNENEGGQKKLRRVASACVKAAIDGDTTAIKEIGDRLDGKAPQATVLQGDPDKPIKHVHEVAFRSGI